jgi:hypothetical protein
VRGDCNRRQGVAPPQVALVVVGAVAAADVGKGRIKTCCSAKPLV